MRKPVTTLLWCCTVVLVVGVGSARAAVISHEKSSPVEPVRSLWKPSKPVKINEDVFCFTAEDGNCNTDTCAETLLCTFDGGSKVTSIETSLPFCGDHGVVVDGQLFCASEQLPSDERNTMSFSVVAFSPKGDTSLHAAVSVEKQFRFEFPKKSKRVYESLIFAGSTLTLGEEAATTYFLPLLAVDSNHTKLPVAFTSPDGFNWKFLSKLPFVSPPKTLHAVQMGKRKIGVVSHTVEGTFERATSSYMGRWWSDVKKLNTTAPPFALVHPLSPLTIEYGVANTTHLSATYHAEDVPKLGRKAMSLSGKTEKKQKKGAQKDGTAAGSSSHAVAYQAAPDRVVTFYDETGADGKKHLQMSSFTIDDREERKLIKEMQEKEAKQKAEEEAARVKAQMERQERLAKERREQRQRDLARLHAFEKADAPHVALARHNYEVDGDFIVVRPSRKETLEYEKKAFFW